MASIFDSLPDPVACLVLSKLRDARGIAKCASVCRRWSMLTEFVDTLTFVSFNLFEKRTDQRRAQDVEALRLNSCSGLVAPSLAAPALLSLDIVNEMDSASAPASMERLAIENLESLDSLDLRGHVLPVAASKALPALRSLTLGGNSWQLETAVEWIRAAHRVRHLKIAAQLTTAVALRLDELLIMLPAATGIELGADFFATPQMVGPTATHMPAAAKPLHAWLGSTRQGGSCRWLVC
eukprot:jgi/Mesen1/7905/ME000420S07055